VALLHRTVSLLAAPGLLLFASHGVRAGMTSTDVGRPIVELSALARTLPDGPLDPLSPFHISLATTSAQLQRIGPVQPYDRMRAGKDIYQHLVLLPWDAEGASRLPAPMGLAVVGADFFFVESDRLAEATLIVRASLGAHQAIAVLERQLGSPEFMVSLPGSVDTVLGWRIAGGRLLVWLSDLDLFRVSAFRGDAQDILAQSQVVLFDGLKRYSERLAAGAPAQELAGELMKVVAWVAIARGKLEPLP
jgi:hypothetical protein